MNERQVNRENWYNKDPKAPEQEASKSIKIAPKAKGELADGFSKVSMPAPKDDGHMQTKSTRDSVGGRWRAGEQLHGKASPASEADCVKVKPNHEAHAK